MPWAKGAMSLIKWQHDAQEGTGFWQDSQAGVSGLSYVLVQLSASAIRKLI